MCGRYYLPDIDLSPDLAQIVERMNRGALPEGFKASGEIFPSDIVPVLANSRRQTIQAFPMRWGYSLAGGRPLINARVETAADKPLFQDGMAQRRCLIPFGHYFEWEKRQGGKVKYAIRPQGDRLMYLAGIYRLEKKADTVFPAFTVLTRAAAPGIAFIHDRMPVILSGEWIEPWLQPGQDAIQVLRHAEQTMRYREAAAATPPDAPSCLRDRGSRSAN